jgi:hypothetical protein
MSTLIIANITKLWSHVAMKSLVNKFLGNDFWKPNKKNQDENSAMKNYSKYQGRWNVKNPGGDMVFPV